jgi:hypothetical protein
VTREGQFLDQVEDARAHLSGPGPGAHEDRLEMAQLAGDLEHLARRQRLVANEDGQAVAAERAVGEHVDMDVVEACHVFGLSQGVMGWTLNPPHNLATRAFV